MGFFNFEGGFDDGYSATIDRVEFAPNQFGALQATITNLLDEPFTGKEGQLVTTRPVWVTVGGLKDWEATPDGKGFRHTSGDTKKRPRSNSQWAVLMDRIVELIGEDEAEKRWPDADPSHGDALVGLHLEWANEGAGKDYKFTDEKTGEVKEGKTKGRLMPIRVVEAGSSNGTHAVATVYDLSKLPEPVAAALKDLAAQQTGAKFTAEAINFLPALAEAGIVRGAGQEEFVAAAGDGSLEAAVKA